MSFWTSPLLRGIEQGELPEVEVRAQVSLDSLSLVKLGLTLVLVAGVVIIFTRLSNG